MAEIVRHADAACYHAKHAGRGNVKVHEDLLLRSTGAAVA
jgi:PleD family two-component response regulator